MNARAFRWYGCHGAAVCALLAELLAPGEAHAQAGAGEPPSAESRADAAESDTDVRPGEPDRNRLRWRRTQLVWQQSASGSTVGIGQDYLSRNPSYEMTFSVSARYLLLDAARHGIAVRADIGVFREFTNSDQTTQRGEWSFTDAAVGGEASWAVYQTDESGTDLFLRAPTLFLPTSKVSQSNGTLFGLGAALGLAQTLPLAGKRAEALQNVTFTLSAGYDRLFTEAVVPTNPELSRVRMNPEGQTIPSDQLSGLPFAEHQANFGLQAQVALTDRISWSASFGYRPVWAYELSDDACIQIQNDCVAPEGVDAPTRYGVITLFGTEFSVRAFEELSVSVGYVNAAGQVGPSGSRRNPFYSPEARFYLSLAAHLDEIYLSASGTREPARRSRVGAGSSPGTLAR